MSNPYDLVVHAETVFVDGEWRAASIAVRDGVVAAIAEFDEEVPAHQVVTLPEGQVLVPGIVDTHVHVNEPGRTEWEGFDTGTRAAAAGGVTTIVDMPLNSIPPTTTVEALELKRSAAAPQARVDVGFWGGAIPSSLGGLEPLWNEGVFGFKCFLSPSGVDEFPHLGTEQLNAALAEIAGFGGLLIVHAEDPDVLDAVASASPGGPGYLDFVASRPDLSEEDAIAHVIAGVRATGARAHILHLSSARALDALRAAKAEGLPITAETCPHYLSFSAEHIPDGATHYKCCPPIRDEGNRDLLWEGLLDGAIDLIASDHSPSTAELKFAGSGDFAEAWGGISGLQLSFPAVWTAARERGIPLERVLGWMAVNTAALVGLASKGAIAVGADADLVAFAPEETFVVAADELEHKNKVSAYDGSTLHGVVHTTWLAGEVVHVAGDRPGAPERVPSGRLLTRPGAGLDGRSTE
ncbi:allantoinase AllB [Herbiconiux sp. KACC 21604]|uniref:allantoinase AllB n=1 Tax=unclassified Herbiconiux TaxID=2618217 RepID=UPI001491FA86|nr:allantoinase AllB [Herbiconiux sp. SALV-R1]QJU54036.1 allantoinase AllB [Herbiconiux sp. SALV-R1]WPO85072.1 allantoinase AllB [Herbiconiux sp. KACC 21604]